MINDNDLLLLASSQNNKTFEVYINGFREKTLTPQTSNYPVEDREPFVCRHLNGNTVQGLLADKNPKKVVFPNCSRATGESGDSSAYGAFQSAFYGCTSLISVSFPALTSATGGSGSGDYGNGDGAFQYAFYDCTSLTSVSFPSLTSASGGSNEGIHSISDGTFREAFRNCTSLTSVSFPVLKTVSGGSDRGAFYEAFRGCTSLTSVSFPALTTTSSNSSSWGAFDYAFEDCTSLTSASFPSLTTATGYRGRSAFYYTFINCSPSLKVHFKKSMQGNTGLDYRTLGLISADQVVFDLP